LSLVYKRPPPYSVPGMRETLKGFALTLALPARGIGSAARARPWTVLAVVGAGLVLHVFLPPLLLAATRKPWTYFAFNPWLKRLPDYLVSGVPLAEKLDFLSRVAVFWFSADGPYGFPEWGFAVDAMDLIRFVAMSLLVGAYVALVLDRRATGRLRARRTTAAPVVGALAGVLGLSTGPCSVVGCGAPVLPVVGLVLAGLSSGTLATLSSASRIASAAVLVTLTLVVVYLGFQSGVRAAAEPRMTTRRSAPG